MPPVAGADFLAALVANCFLEMKWKDVLDGNGIICTKNYLGAFPPVDLRAVCFVRAIKIIS